MLTRLKKILFTLIGIYLLLALFIYFSQYSLLHHPQTYSLKDLTSFADANDIKLWPSTEQYLGLLKEPAGQPAKGTVIIFHGNAGSAANRTHYFRHCAKNNYRTILFEYPGYGPRSGKLTEDSLVNSGCLAVDNAVKEFGKPVLVFGESLGAGVAAAVLNKKSKLIAGAMLITPWDTLASVAQKKFCFIPIKHLVKDSYHSINNLANFPGPVIFVISGKDRIIPAECGLKLAQKFNGKKQQILLENSGHNTWVSALNDLWWQDSFEFLAAN